LGSMTNPTGKGGRKPGDAFAVSAARGEKKLLGKKRTEIRKT